MSFEDITLIRKRYIPNEEIVLKNDIILELTNDLIITKWKGLKPHKNIATGMSAYFLKDGYKVSKIFKEDGSLFRYYCDIIETSYDEKKNTYLFTDLLLDVYMEEDGVIHVVDMDEFADTIENDTITKAQSVRALRSCDRLLRKIYSGEFENIKKLLKSYENK